MGDKGKGETMTLPLPVGLVDETLGDLASIRRHLDRGLGQFVSTVIEKLALAHIA